MCAYLGFNLLFDAQVVGFDEGEVLALREPLAKNRARDLGHPALALGGVRLLDVLSLLEVLASEGIEYHLSDLDLNPQLLGQRVGGFGGEAGSGIHLKLGDYLLPVRTILFDRPPARACVHSCDNIAGFAFG